MSRRALYLGQRLSVSTNVHPVLYDTASSWLACISVAPQPLPTLSAASPTYVYHSHLTPVLAHEARLQLHDNFTNKGTGAAENFALVFLGLGVIEFYDETIHMLYITITFYIENPRTLLEMPTYFPRLQLSLFRHLYLEIPIYGDGIPPDRLCRWAEVINALTKLDGLETLVIILRSMFGLTAEVDGLRAPIEEAEVEGRFVVSPRIIENRVVRMNAARYTEGECPTHGNGRGRKSQGQIEGT
ncbi:hypothetical protein BDV12DRAFT_197810 [Aspergillus spectabilis]